MGFEKRLLDHMDFASACNRPNSISLVCNRGYRRE